MKEKITPCLWFNGKAKEAANFYCTIFPDARITAESPFVTELEISGHKFTCLDGGPQYQPNPSISFFYICETGEELDPIWNDFVREGKVLVPLDTYPWSKKYGWVQDKYGVSWQFSQGDISEVGQKITPSLMFVGDQYGRAEEAFEHYSSIFPDPQLDGILRFGPDESPDREGKVKHAQFALGGQKLMVMDSAQSHDFAFSEGISLMIHCETQEEIDHYWEKLTEGGQEGMCGWLKDKFGVSWQVIPTILSKLMSDPATAQKTAKAFMAMKKFDIEGLIN